MNEHESTSKSRSNMLTFFDHHRFLFLVFGSIIIAIFLVFVALSLYVSSGTSQLDLSRPGYQAIREQVHEDTSFNGFDANGALDKNALNRFQSLYDAKLKEAESFDAYGNDVLSPESLQIDKSSSENAQTAQ